MEASGPEKQAITRVFCREDFLKIARLKESEAGIDPLDLPADERFYDNVYADLFEDTRHLLIQFDGLFVRDVPETDIGRTETRLNFKLTAFSSDINRSLPHAKARLFSAYWQDVATAVFILSSLNLSVSEGLDRVLDLFQSSNKNDRMAFIIGLKHGKNPDITPRLKQMTETCDKELEPDIKDIVLFRENQLKTKK